MVLAISCTALRRQGLIARRACPATVRHSCARMDLFLELRVRTVPPRTLTANQARQWRQAGHRWSRAFAHSFEYPRASSLPGIVEFPTHACLTNRLTPGHKGGLSKPDTLCRFPAPSIRAGFFHWSYYRWPPATIATKASKPLPAGIVPNSVYPGMYRVVRPDGSLSIMVNLTRAKDALRYLIPVFRG